MLSADFSLALTNFMQWIAIASLKTIPLIIFVLLVQRIFRRFLSASANYLLWLTVLISLCIPFGWHIQVTPLAPTTHSTQSTTHHLDEANAHKHAQLKQENFGVRDTESIPNNLLHGFKNTDNHITSGIPVSTLNGTIIFAIFWLVGAIAFLLLIVTRAYQFHRIKISATQASTETVEMLRVCKLEMRVDKNIQLLGTDAIQSPITVGWLNPAIILPKNLEYQLTPIKLKHILLHEIGHIKRQDVFFNWITCLANILHWFNPVVWLACGYIRRDMEIACDALVLSHLDITQHKSYGTTLIEISEIPRVSPRVQTTLGMFENHNELKQRLHMIKDLTTMNIKSSILFGIILTATTITSLAQPGTATSNKPTSAPFEKVSDVKSESMELRDFAKFAEKELKNKVLVGQSYAGTPVQVDIGNEPLDYGKFLTQLKINEFTAYKSKDYIQVVPLRDARIFSIPIVEKGKTYYEDEVVTDYLKTEKACSGQVLAAIRPLIPQYAHLSLHEGARSLIIVDTYGNIQRIKSVIKALEDNIDTPLDCKNIVPLEFRPNPVKQAEKK